MSQPNKILDSYEDALVGQGLTWSQAIQQSSKLQSYAEELVDRNDPELNARFELLSDIPPEELEEELSLFIQDIANNNYSEEEQLEMANEVFNIIGIGFEKNRTNDQVEIKLVDPTY